MVNAHRLTTGRKSRVLAGALVALMIAVLGSLATSARAQAACTSAKSCFDAAQGQTIVAKDYFNKGVWFREHARQHFGEAYNWNEKARFAFAAGNPDAAWAKAVADDFAKTAAREAAAADDMFARAKFTSAAADDSFNRGMFFNALDGEGGSSGEITIAGTRFSKSCVPKKAKHPSIRWIPGCTRRAILRVSSPAGVAAAANAAFHICVTGHLAARAQPPAGALISLYSAQAWCSEWRWGWVVVRRP